MRRRNFIQAVFASCALFTYPRPWWSGRIVRQPFLVRGQREFPFDDQDSSSVTVRTPVRGSPERAYLEYMAKRHPHPEYRHSDSNTLARIDRGDLSVEDVGIRLLSEQEINTQEFAFGRVGRGDAYASHILIGA